MTPDLIGLCGISGCGKDTIGQLLCDFHGFTRVAVADPIKEQLMSLFDLDRAQLWGDRRNEIVERLGRSPRQLFQEFGDFCEDRDMNVWARLMSQQIAHKRNDGNRVVVTDVRTERVAEAIRQLGGVLWLVRRPRSGAPGHLGQHRHERELPLMPPDYFDRVLDNNRTRAHLSVLVGSALLGLSTRSTSKDLLRGKKWSRQIIKT